MVIFVSFCLVDGVFHVGSKEFRELQNSVGIRSAVLRFVLRERDSM